MGIMPEVYLVNCHFHLNRHRPGLLGNYRHISSCLRWVPLPSGKACKTLQQSTRVLDWEYWEPELGRQIKALAMVARSTPLEYSLHRLSSVYPGNYLGA